MGFSSCVKKTEYIEYVFEGIQICDLDFLDTINFIGLAESDRTLQSVEQILLSKNWQTEWKIRDINRTRCSEKEYKIQANRALRVYTNLSDLTNGYELRYDFYFDSENKLVSIESRHVYVDF